MKYFQSMQSQQVAENLSKVLAVTFVFYWEIDTISAVQRHYLFHHNHGLFVDQVHMQETLGRIQS